MFKGFDLKITEGFWGSESEYKDYIKKGEMHLNEQKVEYEDELKKYVKDRKLDGSKIQNEWFPQVKANIFLSHSHDDKPLACALAGWLNQEFGLNCFIDSNVWGYSEKLLDIMNTDLSNRRTDKDGSTLYDHNSCNQVSQHVNMMLSVALQKMIDKTEAIILLNTDNSIPVHHGSSMDETYSPWIYSEIICTQIVRNKPLIAYRDYSVLSHSLCERDFSESVNKAKKIEISYTVSLSHLLKLNETILKTWKKKKIYWNQEYKYKYEYALDFLYEIICPLELEIAKKMSEILTSEECNTIRKFYKGIDVDAQYEKEVVKILSRCFEKEVDK